ncbi:MAG: T9SS type A sorting domain-containing protein [Bacteroidetes bacterium]|nr:T9SS type A sorting domain-containing protein [Bacteroidota bacterium]
MKKYVKIFLLLFFIIVTVSNSYSQGLNTMAYGDSNTVFAFGDNGKVLKTYNGGLTWSRTTLGTANFVSSAAVGSFFMAASNDGKVTRINFQTGETIVYTTPATSINGCNFRGFSDGFIVGNNGSVYKSTDFGISWTLKNSGIPGTVKLNAIGGTDPYYITVGDGGVAYKTTNGGNNWTALTTGTTKNLLTVFTSGPLVDYFVGGESGAYFSGTVSVAGNPTVTYLTPSDIRTISGVNSFYIRIGGGQGFIRNNTFPNGDGFAHFEPNPLMSDLSCITVNRVNLNGTYYACSNKTDAIIKTTNNGANWEFTGGATKSISWVTKLSASGGIGNNLCMNPNNKNEMYVVYGKNMYRSMDRCETWTNFGTVGATSGTISIAHSFYVSTLDTNVLMCAIEGTPTDKVVRSTNYGATWTTIIASNFSSYGMPLEMDQNTPGVFYYAPDNGGFWKSTDNGATFTEISGAYPFRSPCDVVVEWGNSNNILLADGITGSGVADIFKSTNGGVNWVKVFTNTSGASEIPSMCNSQFDKNLVYATNWSSANRYKSTNAGSNWAGIQSTSFSGWGSDICHEDPNVVLTGNYGQGSSFSTNGGTSWTEYNMPAGGCGAGIIVPERGYLVAMECSALLKMNVTYNVITNVEEQTLTGIPSKYNLYQNYPNPFNPITEIRYDIVNPGNVSMKVFDQSGKEVYNLVNGFKNAGSYSVKFDAASFASGVYYYTLETGGNIFTKKMILVK